MNITIENEYARYVIGSDGANLHFIDKQTGADYCVTEPKSSFARVKQAGQEVNASAASYTDGRITVRFGESGVSAVIGVTAKERYFVFEVLSVTGEQVEELVFVDISLTVQGTPEEL